MPPPRGREKQYAALLLEEFAVGLCRRELWFLHNVQKQELPITPQQVQGILAIEGKLRRIICDAVKGRDTPLSVFERSVV
jgi:hypothetical protein